MVHVDELPESLLQEISKRLTFLQDYVRLRATCCNFYSLIPPTPKHLPLQLPWLFYPGQQNRRFFNLSTSKFHHLSFPNISRNQRECGSSQGWLVILDESPEIVLVNPLKGLEQEKVHLPPLTTFPNVIGFYSLFTGCEYYDVKIYKKRGQSEDVSSREMRECFIKKIIISSTPLKDAGFVAVALLSKSVAYYKSGGPISWRFIGKPFTSCQDITYHNELLYAVNYTMKTMVCNLKNDPPTVSIITNQRIPTQPYLRDSEDLYLVGSADELFLVMRFFASRFDSNFLESHRTRSFQVWKIDRRGELPRWKAVTNLGERALFVGQNDSVCIMASEFSGCMGNCIYFTSHGERMTFNDRFVEYDTGIYKLSDGTIESLPPCHNNQWPPPIWVTPNTY